jgi:transposase-like protein
MPAYPEEFRRDAVELLVNSGRSLKEVADELGVTSNTLRARRNNALGAGNAGGSRDGRKPGEGAPVADAP